jgi:RNA polymerase sigma-70 factor, ECF subfamily
MEESDFDVIARVREGNEDVFRLLVERYSHRLFQLAFRMTGSESDAEDIVQESFLKAYRQLSRFEERANFSTWLHRIAVNCCLDHLRKRKRLHEEHRVGEESTLDNIPASTSLPEHFLFHAEVEAHVTVALNELSQLEKAAFVLRHFEERSIEEIGSTLGLGVSATKQSIFRAVKKMRRVLEPIVRSVQ